MTPASIQRWNPLAQLFHWLIAALIILQGSLGLWMVSLPKRPGVIPIFSLHKSIGLTILALALLRLCWRLATRRPPLPVHIAGWQGGTARATHIALYVLLFATPLSGWLFDSAASLRPLYWWGLLRMPNLTGGPDAALKSIGLSLHITLFWTLVAVTVLHVAAALKHHFIDRDTVLVGMLPFGRAHSREKPP
ncbi:MAG TPA: cytochrome b [Rhodanobacteraceae bacterium]|nr:cytochrome b [Rhodanobacteraceae bacterium]